MKDRKCKELGCDNKLFASQYCSKHYTRLYRHGCTTILTETEKFWKKVIIPTDRGSCWEWQGNLNGAGYGRHQFNNHTKKAHRVSWYLTKGSWPKLDLLHVCDNPKCVNPGHLFEGTQSDNVADMVRKNRQIKGSKVHCSKLNETQVRQIRNLLDQNYRPTIVAGLFKVSSQTVRSISKGDIWGWLK